KPAGFALRVSHLRKPSPHQFLSGKPKVYQGVRVKITVKELLQQRRARQAATSAAVSKTLLVSVLSLLSSSFSFSLISGPRRLSESKCSRLVSWGGSSGSNIQFSESVSPPHPAPFDAEPISSVPTYCPSWQFSSCLSCEESPSYLEQLLDSCLQTEAPLDPASNACQTASHYTSDAFQPVPLCFNQGLACCCTACGSQHVDGRAPQYFCPSTDCMDYLPPLADDFFRRDRTCDICYS
ncbi:POU class 2 homeobox associating factor 3, partial [Dryobates pubescens]|uniref:POU class 2 homeobox associating factor 3 n=1 Tax=Dryobates pubescens TaxID=118200 RepID=UPI0023B91804